MLYELIELKEAFKRDNDFETMNAILKEPLPKIENDDELNTILKM